METLDQKKRRLFGKQYLKQYLLELNKLVKYSVDESNLISIIETDKLILKESNDFNIKLKFNFEEKSSILKDIFEKLPKNKKYFLLTSFYKDCGALKINSLTDFNFNFLFTDEHTGLIQLICENQENKIIMDYYQEKEVKEMELEIMGCKVL